MLTASMTHTFADSLLGTSTIDAEHLPHEFQEAAQNGGSVLRAISCQQLGTRTYSAEAAVDDVLAWNIAYTGRHDRDAHAGGHQTEGGLYLHRALRDGGPKASLLVSPGAGETPGRSAFPPKPPTERERTSQKELTRIVAQFGGRTARSMESHHRSLSPQIQA